MVEENRKQQQPEVAALPAPTKRRNPLVVAGIVALVVSVGTASGFFFFGGSDQPEVQEALLTSVEQPATALMEGADDSVELAEGEEAMGAIFPFDAFIVNLSGGQFIRLQVQVEFEGPEVPKKMYARMVPIRDAIITHLTTQTAVELQDLKGKEKLKKTVREIINERLRQQDVRRVYFTQFVIQ